MPNADPLRVLTLNSGSSSIKFAILEMSATESLIASGKIDRIGLPGSLLRVTSSPGGAKEERELAVSSHAEAVKTILQWLGNRQDAIDAVGHRLVHGGQWHRQTEPITPELLADLRDLIPLDPNHLPRELDGISAIAAAHPNLPQFACFDTGFHANMPMVAQILPFPRSFYDEGILRYGFHGLSYEYIMSELVKLEPATAARGKVVIAHLGSGASMAAVHNGVGIDTTMAFTPTAGLVMATRTGDIDPGVLIYLLEHKKMSASDLNVLVNKRSGLLGVSGVSSDMADLLAREQANPNAALAIDLFCYSAKKTICGLAAALGGLDALVFTGGIGENSPQVRERICHGLDFVGISLEDKSNQQSADLISSPESRVRVRVIKTNEELTIARRLFAMMRSGS